MAVKRSQLEARSDKGLTRPAGAIKHEHLRSLLLDLHDFFVDHLEEHPDGRQIVYTKSAFAQLGKRVKDFIER
tara:strand:- start:253 stop:471 length:219 start_codon:yes stop_codon:yes gene_type:complete